MTPRSSMGLPLIPIRRSVTRDTWPEGGWHSGRDSPSGQRGVANGATAAAGTTVTSTSITTTNTLRTRARTLTRATKTGSITRSIAGTRPTEISKQPASMVEQPKGKPALVLELAQAVALRVKAPERVPAQHRRADKRLVPVAEQPERPVVAGPERGTAALVAGPERGTAALVAEAPKLSQPRNRVEAEQLQNLRAAAKPSQHRSQPRSRVAAVPIVLAVVSLQRAAAEAAFSGGSGSSAKAASSRGGSSMKGGGGKKGGGGGRR